MKFCTRCGLTRICTFCLEDQVIAIVGSPIFISVKPTIEKLARVCCVSYEDSMLALIDSHRDVKNSSRT